MSTLTLIATPDPQPAPQLTLSHVIALPGLYMTILPTGDVVCFDPAEAMARLKARDAS